METYECSCDLSYGHILCDLCLDKIAEQQYNKEEK
jgi:hypothetical protein